MMTYGFLLETVWHPPLAFAEEVARELPPELELQALWFSGAFGQEFRTTDGRKIRIVQFGEWNRSAGPDFAQAAVEVDGELKTGALELDPEASCWEMHGHGSNPAFDNVILHVVFQSDERRLFTRTSHHREVPQVVISPSQLADALNRPLREVAIAHPGRCVFPLKQRPVGAVERLLKEAAQHRAALKAGRFLRTAAAHGQDAALFQATAETLGYGGNALAMRLLSQRVRLADARDDAEAILFGSAGFLSPVLHEQAPEDTREYLRELWDTWWKLRARFEMPPERKILWKCHGQRPANHPHRRIGTLATLVGNWQSYRKLALARPFSPKPLIEFLHGLEHPFWSFRHTLTSSRSAGRVALFGKTQAVELLANHLIPLALHDEGMTFESYRKLRASPPNEKVKRCSIRLFGSLEAAKPWLRRTADHQALLQVYQDFCLEDFSACDNCPFPEQLSQWK